MFQDTSTNWPAFIGVTLGLVSAIVGVAVAYLRLFIRGENAELKEEILNHIDQKFALKEIMLEKFAHLEKSMDVRFSGIEARIKTLEDRR